MPELTFDLLQQEVEYVRLNNEFQDAFDCYNMVKSWLETKSGIAKNTPKYNEYYRYLVKFKFLSLNYFDDVNDYVDLLKNYFNLTFDIPYFNVWDKIEIKLVSISDLDERDEFKSKLKSALEKSDNILLDSKKYNQTNLPVKVSDWIKDFIVSLGLDEFDKVKKAEYISNGRFIKMLNQEDREKVKLLLDLYEKLKTSSRQKNGYENSVVMNLDGKLIIFNRGDVDEVKSLPKLNDEIVVGSINSSVVFTSVSNDANSELGELENMLRNYPAGTLEHKAISQEISRLKVLELKAAQQKSNVKR